MNRGRTKSFLIVLASFLLTALLVNRPIEQFYKWRTFPESAEQRLADLVRQNGVPDCSVSQLSNIKVDPASVSQCFKRSELASSTIQQNLRSGPGKESLTAVFECRNDTFNGRLIIVEQSTGGARNCTYSIAFEEQELVSYSVGEIPFIPNENHPLTTLLIHFLGRP